MQGSAGNFSENRVSGSLFPVSRSPLGMRVKLSRISARWKRATKQPGVEAQRLRSSRRSVQRNPGS